MTALIDWITSSTVDTLFRRISWVPAQAATERLSSILSKSLPLAYSLALINSDSVIPRDIERNSSMIAEMADLVFFGSTPQ